MLADPKLKEIHPLGKSPVISIESPDTEKPIVIAESGAIVEYLVDYYGKHMIPDRFKPGKEGKIGGESEEWLRYRFFMHYAEGSLMTILLLTFFVLNIKNASVPFFIKPITNMITSRIDNLFLIPNQKTHFSFLEQQIKTSGGEFLCGNKLTGADILMIFPLEMSEESAGKTPDKYPKICAYVDRIKEREAYKKAVQKIIEVEGEYNPAP